MQQNFRRRRLCGDLQSSPFSRRHVLHLHQAAKRSVSDLQAYGAGPDSDRAAQRGNRDIVRSCRCTCNSNSKTRANLYVMASSDPPSPPPITRSRAPCLACHPSTASQRSHLIDQGSSFIPANASSAEALRYLQDTKAFDVAQRQ
jgi:hypothetical protein